MQTTIDKILQAINECKDPIKNTQSREKRDAILSELSAELIDKTREQVEGYARNEDEAKSLHWFYTRFISNKAKSSASKMMD
ncbi:hypothetical protein [Sphingobacterium daejeonense]|uniref:hypothetical protein n=1 Tax=Sphingobacterium daejeonense TaxID=371142 RepID=UPI0010C5246C|nr:hypothetical protein [Sphingobacterium daejeonense]VTQ00372.1 Uncharacterised protein [Sphingobacterium daejeonense]